MKSKIEINISVIDDGPVVMRCQGQNTSKGKALDALEDAYLSTVAQLMRKDLSKAEQEEAAKEFGETMQDRLLALAVVLAGLGSCAEQEEDEKPCKERQPQEKRAADRRKAD